MAQTVRWSCAGCGAVSEHAAGGVPTGWSTVTEGEGVERECPECVRANIRSIEAKLPRHYWQR